MNKNTAVIRKKLSLFGQKNCFFNHLLLSKQLNSLSEEHLDGGVTNESTVIQQSFSRSTTTLYINLSHYAVCCLIDLLLAVHAAPFPFLQ